MRRNTHQIIDCYNDKQMVAEGLRLPRMIINRSEFKKTPEERVKLQNAKSKYKRSISELNG